MNLQFYIDLQCLRWSIISQCAAILNVLGDKDSGVTQAQSILSAVLLNWNTISSDYYSAVGNSLPWRHWVPLLQPGVGRDSVKCMMLWTQHQSHVILRVHFLQHSFTHRNGNQKVDRRINIINAKRDNNKLQIQENHKKSEHLWNIFGTLDFSLLFQTQRMALDISGLWILWGRPVHPRLPKQPQPLWAPWNILEHWNATMSRVCFWLFLSATQHVNQHKKWNWDRDNPKSSDFDLQIKYIISYHNISQQKQSYAELCAIKSFLVTNFGLWIQSLSNYRCAKNVPRLPPSHRCGPGRGVGRRAATSPDPRFCTSAFRSVDSSQTFQPFSQHRDSIPVPIDHLPNKVHPVHRWAAKI